MTDKATFGDALRQTLPDGGEDAAEQRGRVQRWTFGFRRRMRELLALSAVEGEERDYLEGLGLPPENIDNCMLVMGMLFRESLKGNIKMFQELKDILGDNETELDRRIKLAQLGKTKAQTEALKQKQADGSEDDDAAFTLAEVLEESAASLWAVGTEEGGVTD